MINHSIAWMVYWGLYHFFGYVTILYFAINKVLCF
jgi:hypothetical protein